MITIQKDTYPGFDSKPKIQAEIGKAEQELYRRHNGPDENFQFTAQSWAHKIAEGEPWEYIAKTKEQIEAEKAAEAKKEEVAARTKRLISAQGDKGIKKKLIEEYLNQNDFPKYELPFMLARLNLEEIDQPEFDAFQKARLAKKQEIIDEIQNAKA